MNRGANRSSIFFDDNDRIEVGQRLAEIHERFEIEVRAYCLMANHFHLLLHCPNGGLSPAMQRFSSLFTRHVNDRHGRDGSIFRGRFHSRVIAEETYLLNADRLGGFDPATVADVLEIPTRGAYRTALSRARAAAAARHEVCKAVEITVSLAG